MPDPSSPGSNEPPDSAVLDRPDPDPHAQREPLREEAASHDVIVVGLGIMGLATCWQLARRGVRVLGIEQYDQLQNLGSSHGSSRVIRRAYFEHPDYVALLDRAYAGWKELEDEAGEALVNFCGALTIGPADGVLIPGVRLADERHAIGCERLAPNEAAARFPALNLEALPAGWEIVFEPGAGYIHAERARAALLQAARDNGATLLATTHMQRWEETGDGVTVITDEDSFGAKHLVLACGAWAKPTLAELGVPLTLVRKLAFWYLAACEELIRPDNLPCFIIEDQQGFHYGVPDNEDTAENGVKIARHDEDAVIREIALLESGDEMRMESWVEEQEEIERPRIEEFARRWLAPALLSPEHPDLIHSDTAVCMYSYSPDGHFILDRHPTRRRVSLAAGFSGHGFKFAPVVGSIMADLATGGKLPDDARFLGLERFR